MRWSEKQLRHCLRFAETFEDEKIVSALRRALSWTHIKTKNCIRPLSVQGNALSRGRNEQS